MVLSAFILITAIIAAQLLCVGHSFTPYLNIDLDISDLEVAIPHNFELLEENNQTTDIYIYIYIHYFYTINSILRY